MPFFASSHRALCPSPSSPRCLSLANDRCAVFWRPFLKRSGIAGENSGAGQVVGIHFISEQGWFPQPMYEPCFGCSPLSPGNPGSVPRPPCDPSLLAGFDLVRGREDRKKMLEGSVEGQGGVQLGEGVCVREPTGSRAGFLFSNQFPVVAVAVPWAFRAQSEGALFLGLVHLSPNI